MLVGGIVVAVVVIAVFLPMRRTSSLIAMAIAPAVLLIPAAPASAAIVPTVALATAANYSVLGASTVTNTGPSILAASLGVWPGTSITGFPPGLVIPPGTTDTTNAAANQAQSDLTAAYVNAAGRPVDATTTADLANLNLGAGVYSGPNKSPLMLTGPLTLNGAGDPNSVFIFQTDSTLITGSGSTVTLINGAQACNVFWQVGSSATLGTASVFTGNILALTSITVTTGVLVHGRALARNGAVTLDTDVFTNPSCSVSSPVITTTPGGGHTPPATGGGTGVTTPTGGPATTTLGAGSGSITSPGRPGSTTAVVPAVGTASPPQSTVTPPRGPRIPGLVGPPLAFTGANLTRDAILGITLLGIGGVFVAGTRRRVLRRPD
jgi:hypothetical protein